MQLVAYVVVEPDVGVLLVGHPQVDEEHVEALAEQVLDQR